MLKSGIHPKYVEATVTCACGSTFKTRSTKPEIRVEICSQCHPFYTGRQKMVDTEGRVDRFVRRMEKKTEPVEKKPRKRRALTVPGATARASSKKTEAKPA